MFTGQKLLVPGFIDANWQFLSYIHCNFIQIGWILVCQYWSKQLLIGLWPWNLCLSHAGHFERVELHSTDRGHIQSLSRWSHCHWCPRNQRSSNRDHITRFIKKQYHAIKGVKVERGLKAVTKKEGFEFTGIHHRAIADAENLAKIVAKYIDEWVVWNFKKTIIEWTITFI